MNTMLSSDSALHSGLGFASLLHTGGVYVTWSHTESNRDIQTEGQDFRTKLFSVSRFDTQGFSGLSVSFWKEHFPFDIHFLFGPS